MPSDAIRLTGRHRVWTYGVGWLLFLSGVAWQTLQWLPNENGPSPHSAAPWLMRLHGAAAMAALVLLGTLIPLHLRRGWIARRNRISGVVFTSVCGLLVVTGYALYYAGSESVRNAASLVHLGVGLATPLALVWHLWLGRKSRTLP